MSGGQPREGPTGRTPSRGVPGPSPRRGETEPRTGVRQGPEQGPHEPRAGVAKEPRTGMRKGPEQGPHEPRAGGERTPNRGETGGQEPCTGVIFGTPNRGDFRNPEQGRGRESRRERERGVRESGRGVTEWSLFLSLTLSVSLSL